MTLASSLMSQSQRIHVDRKQQAIKLEDGRVGSERVAAPPIPGSGANKRVTVGKGISLNQESDKEQSVVESRASLQIVTAIIVLLIHSIRCQSFTQA